MCLSTSPSVTYHHGPILSRISLSFSLPESHNLYRLKSVSASEISPSQRSNVVLARARSVCARRCGSRRAVTAEQRRGHDAAVARRTACRRAQGEAAVGVR